MRLIGFATLALLALLAASTGHAFSLSYKLKKLLAHQQKSSSNDQILDLSSSSFETYLEGERNYTVVLLMTAMDERFGCQPCRLIDPIYRIVAKSYWMAPSAKPQLFFALLDFSQGQEAFRKMGLESAPNLFLFKPQDGSGLGDYSRYDLNEPGSFNADDIANWISRQTNLSIKVYKPVDYVTPVLGLVSVLSVLALIKMFLPRVLPLLQSARLWSTACLMFIIHMSSGAMWNRIRGAPYAGRSQDGRPELFAGGSQSQYQIETQIVSLVYAVLAVCMVVMIKHVPKIQNVSTQRLAVYVGMGVFLSVYSWLISIFSFKNGGYPFKLFL